MDFSSDVESAFSLGGDDSDGFVPEVKSKAKAATKGAPRKATAAAAKPAKAVPKKMTQTTLSAKPAAKKRPKADSDDDGMLSDASVTPPAKKARQTAPKKPSGKVLGAIENDSLALDDDDADVAPARSKGGNKSASDTYQKLTQLEHIIKRPDTYIGSVERTEQLMWVLNKQTMQMEHRNVGFVPGLYKIFDEILVNAADNKQRDPTMTYMKIAIDRAEGTISVENNGKAIPVVIHQKEGVYIPELVFGHLLAGSNFDDNEKKTVGGRNGYGAKLCNVFSTEFTLEVQDSENGKRYKQTWTDNMQNMGKAKITASKNADFVRVTFKPDYARFNMPDGIDDDLEGLLYRRIYDMAGTVRGVKVHLNGELIKLKNFEAYCEMYAKAIAQDRVAEQGDSGSGAKVWIDKDKGHPRWEVGFAVSDGSFQQVSFVNSIATTSGGTHVNYIADQICASLLKHLSKKIKGHSLKANNIRNHIFIFVNCLVDNPAFNSQTKETLSTKMSAFGSKCELGDDFLKKIAQSEALTNIMAFAEKKADKLLAKSDGNKRSRISNAKLTEANFAGTRRGWECTLILTEGDSAKGLAVSGRAALDPDRIGVFPLRGKMLNVRDASIDQITKNAEIQNIKQILGLKHKKEYTDAKELRYGHLMIMADQDHDGSHIKGLLINFLQCQFPSLLKIDDFFQEFITPIVKVWKGPNPDRPQQLKWFFTQPEYETWKKQPGNERWETKYLKGLGSSSNKDAQRYFAALDDHLKQFETMRESEAELFELAFSKKKADARKEWLGSFVPGTFLDHTSKSITYDDFVNKELILFSMADNMRSIPSMLDGFKPGQRKVLFGCFLRNLVKDMKVYELSGFVSQKSAYHHGDVSLQQTIIGLAQDFVGSNNLNLLEPSGNFGSRLQGGGDAASPRYIFTRLSPFARKLFPAQDEPILDWQYEEGKKIEPKTYAPIIPMVLANGADGIGTGWSTNIPNYHPRDLVDNIKKRMGRFDPDSTDEQPFSPMMPWYRGWKGTSEQCAPDKYKFNGVVDYSEDRPAEVIIKELPIRMWTEDFKTRLEEVIAGTKGPSWIKDYKEFNDHDNVRFEIALDEKQISAVVAEGLLERFKLLKQVSVSNLVAFNTRGQIQKYACVEDIMEEFYHYRFGMYTKRRAHWLSVLHTEYRKLRNQARFVKEIIDGDLTVGKKKKTVLVAELRQRKYEAFPPAATKKNDDNDDEGGAAEEDDLEEEGGSARDFDYLLGMPIWSLTAERLDKLNDSIAKKKQEHDELETLDEKDLWCRDLDAFLEAWEHQVEERSKTEKGLRNMGRRASKKIGAGPSKRGKNAAKGDDEYSPVKPKAAPRAKAEPKKVETKTHERFAEKFGALKPPRPKKEDSDGDDDAFGDEDFGALSKPKKAAAKKDSGGAPKQESDEEMVDVPAAPVRSRRAAATKVRAWIVDETSEDEDENLLGDVGAMVKGIGAQQAGSADNARRVSLYSMSRPTSGNNGGSGSGGETTPAALSRPAKAKPLKMFDFDDSDGDTNYELLAKPSPHKSPTKPADAMQIDEAEDDDDFATSAKAAAAANKAPPVAATKPLTVAPVKKRGRPAGAKAKPKDSDEDDDVIQLDDSDDDVVLVKAKKSAATKKAAAAAAPSPAKATTTVLPLGQSPAAKAYAAKKAAARVVISDDDGDDDDDAEIIMRKKAAPAAKKRAVVDDDDDDDDVEIVPKKKAAPAPKKRAVVDEDDDDDEEIVPKKKKAAAAPAAKKRTVVDDDDEDESIAPRAAGRSRPARAAVSSRPKPKYTVDSDEDEDEESDLTMDDADEDDEGDFDDDDD